jgi:hypothetical protein
MFMLFLLWVFGLRRQSDDDDDDYVYNYDEDDDNNKSTMIYTSYEKIQYLCCLLY